MRKIYSYLTCGTQLFFLLFTLFHRVTSTLDQDGSRPNGTKYEAFFQNDFSQVENRVKSHSIRSSGSPKEIGHLVNELLTGYDRRAWPTYGTNQPTLVTVNIYINSLGSVSAANMDFGMDVVKRQSWVKSWNCSLESLE
ncbi:hypothetical protein AVEN_155926-1 [Araneus ventricosus]|uniref:Neurotransmitter-gated ion-channel ligand-binding domain-containing protein n=1 Tax=Araneus ventricosus TaxID=182803 RepID=A0A4Y2M291_ARAVE|nr:hypothetical protein AVEN_155926-1 [Araneus ventricosus]